MPDGVRLSARLWLPESEQPVPAILEIIPYRKRDLTRIRDERNHPCFAAHGYACLRVDMRGSGDSEGAMHDMYTPPELSDTRHVIDWIARQNWCSGRVGMFGTSWGGTAGLQAAVDAPGPLKAVIANCATIDRFEDDIHWMGGCVLTDTLEWGATLPAILAAPPDEATTGDGWFNAWRQRLRNLRFPQETWLRRTERDRYWRRGSVRFEMDRLNCPILAIGGWSDRYSNSVMPLVQARPDICRGIVGPWGHHYPDQGEPGPAIGFQALALAWWDCWLKSGAPAMPDWPLMRLWRREFDPPEDRLRERNGLWIDVDQPVQTASRRFHLAAGRLSVAGAADCALKIPVDMAHGQCAGDTGYFGRSGGLPLEQSPDDARALCFDSDPLDHELCVLGQAELIIGVNADALPTQLACRLCDVDPDGQSNLITRMIVNPEHGEELACMRLTRSGGQSHLGITFPGTAYRIAAGHRLRLAIGSSYWPLIWPAGERRESTILTSGSALLLPLQPSEHCLPGDPFPPPQAPPDEQRYRITSVGPLQRKCAGPTDGMLRNGWQQPAATTELKDTHTVFTGETVAEFTAGSDPGHAVGCVFTHSLNIQRPSGLAAIACRVSMRELPDDVKCESTITVSWNGEELASLTSEIPCPQQG